MPPKNLEAAQRKTIASATKRKKHKRQDEEDDALLDRLLTKQETGGMDLIIDEVLVTERRYPNPYVVDGDIPKEEENRRVARAVELQRAAEIRKQGRSSGKTPTAFNQAKELLAKTLLALAGKDVPADTSSLAPWSNRRVRMELESAGMGDPPNTRNLTPKLRYIAASSIYKLLKQRLKGDNENTTTNAYLAKVLASFVALNMHFSTAASALSRRR